MRREAAYRGDQFQPYAHSLLCIVLVSLGEAEVNQEAIAHELWDAIAHGLRYESAEALHRLRDTLLIGGDDLAEVFGVHMGRERR